MKKVLPFIILLFSGFMLFAQNPWSKANQRGANEDDLLNKNLTVKNYTLFALDESFLNQHISKAPQRNTTEKSNAELYFPVSGSSFKLFKLYKTKTLSEGLAKKFPSIKSYIGETADKKYKIRITLSPQGFFGMISHGEEITYINPNNKSGSIYTVFRKKSITATNTFLNCLSDKKISAKKSTQPVTQADVDDATLRNYELAVATTGEYAQFHINQMNLNNASTFQQMTGVLAAITTTIDRVNEVYERDLAITFTLVPNNDLIIYLNPNTDPFTNSNPGILINESQTEINSTIGNSNYDIGHTFSTGAGGLAALFSVCTNAKASGVTGISAPIGDPFDVDYVCHEFGHQFGANHTFNGDNGSCGSNRNNATAVEPGSGVTIMGYAGLCPGENIQNNSIPFFHAISIDEIFNNLTNGPGGACPDNQPISNQAPVIQTVPNYTIPSRTAFALEASATDADGDNLTYSWEQVDNEIAIAPPSAFSSEGALFRSVDASSSPIRYFPQLANIVDGNLTPTWEVIPIVARDINFSLTVRDNNPNGGQNTREDFSINVTSNGPFRVTSQNNSSLSYNQNETVPITWDVAGTTGNGINTPTVDILLSYDNGVTFPEVLISNVPNDGLQNISTPIGTASENCRIMVKAVDNIFLAVNSEPFEITNILSNPTVQNIPFALYPNPTNNGKFVVNLDNSGEPARLTIYNLQGRLIYTQDLQQNINKHSINLNNPQSGLYLVKVSKGSNTIVKKLLVK
ncbi:zinc-dependent metalloprotease [Mesonia aquimarina]|uniref:zinc-dependent metalloprotease n=1 Tax=Mesonia aquimarina TaxID=1504967 RepID=UPI000EF580A3|nr:zinc-dependent metalloprotease [Mesonia aquimarina]